MQSFAYYEGLGPRDTHSPSRTDGTSYNMPCITPEDIAAAEDRSYVFWHGHSTNHTFVVTSADFQALQRGQSVMIYTSVVDDHRHALLIKPGTRCGTNLDALDLAE